MYLGIDIGTGGTRALLVDSNGAVRASHTSAHEDMRMERPLWAEQRPENWWDAAGDAIRGVVTQAGIPGREGGGETVLRHIANPVLAGFTLPKLLWVRDHEPPNYERARKMLLPKDYVRYKLTGEFATEVPDASGTAGFDVVH